MTPRVLVCVTVGDDDDVALRALDSLQHVDTLDASVDVLVLDDCSAVASLGSPLADQCLQRDFGYYRSPRRLGRPRNINLGLLSAMRGGYDHVIVVSSGAILPKNLVAGLLAAAGHESVGSVTAWSNGESAFCLPSEDPDHYLADQDVVDWMSQTFADRFDGSVIDVPVANSSCMLIPVPVVRAVGLMDPVFHHGPCEDWDWAQRSVAAGYRVALAPGVLTYDVGAVTAGDSTQRTHSYENQAIVDLRFPSLAGQIEAHELSGVMERVRRDAAEAVTVEGAKQYGYTLDVGWLPRAAKDENLASCVIAPDGLGTVSLRFLGFASDLGLPDERVAGRLRELFGREATATNIYDVGPVADRLRAEGGDAVFETHSYPTRV